MHCATGIHANRPLSQNSSLGIRVVEKLGGKDISRGSTVLNLSHHGMENIMLGIAVAWDAVRLAAKIGVLTVSGDLPGCIHACVCPCVVLA